MPSRPGKAGSRAAEAQQSERTGAHTIAIFERPARRVMRTVERSGSSVRLLSSAFVVVLALATSLQALADDDNGKRDTARAAYDRGTHLLDQGDDDGALAAFLEADSIIPSVAGLDAAAIAAEHAHPGPALEQLCRRIEERPIDDATLTRARARCESGGFSFGSVVIECTSPCDPRVDGAAISPGIAMAVTAGTHSVTIGSETGMFDVRAHARVTRDFRAPPSASPPAPKASDAPSDKPLSPAWFAAFAATTAVLGGGAIASGVDTANQHAHFVDDHCALAPSRRVTSDATCLSIARTGSNASTRTNALVGVTAGLGVATALVGLFAVRWSPAKRAPTLSFGPAGVSIVEAF
jgi:hypothetical protein